MTNINTCVANNNRRRSIRSARTPAGIASRTIGVAIAVRTAETICGEASRSVISQPAPISCIQVPTLDTNDAIQNERKTGLRSGTQGDPSSALSGCTVALIPLAAVA